MAAAEAAEANGTSPAALTTSVRPSVRVRFHRVRLKDYDRQNWQTL